MHREGKRAGTRSAGRRDRRRQYPPLHLGLSARAPPRAGPPRVAEPATRVWPRGSESLGYWDGRALWRRAHRVGASLGWIRMGHATFLGITQAIASKQDPQFSCPKEPREEPGSGMCASHIWDRSRFARLDPGGRRKTGPSWDPERDRLSNARVGDGGPVRRGSRRSC